MSTIEQAATLSRRALPRGDSQVGDRREMEQHGFLAGRSVGGLAGVAMMKLSTLCLVGLFVLAGCTLPRREAPTAFFDSATPVGFPSNVRYYSADWRRLGPRASERLQRVRSASPDGTINVPVPPKRAHFPRERTTRRPSRFQHPSVSNRVQHPGASLSTSPIRDSQPRPRALQARNRRHASNLV
jgi:hypothetical protein